MMNFSPSDRVLVVAPHPDDESLATGGLIQRVCAAGAAIRVIWATNGDNNPWPQRWVEKRWRIRDEDRARWGAMRQSEARKALERLGFEGESAFLNLPDQGVTDLLMANDPAALRPFVEALRDWRPTHLIGPTPCDLHPDHSALYVLLRTALHQQPVPGLQRLHYAVHGPFAGQGPVRVALSAAEIETKRAAIECHHSQMVLSRKRFLWYARPEEDFFHPKEPEILVPEHPVSEAFFYDGMLHLAVHLPWVPLGLRENIWLAGESAAGSFRRKLSIRGRGRVKIKLPMEELNPTLLFVKYHRPTLFLDHAGWRGVPLRKE